MSLLLEDPWFIAKVERAIAIYGRGWTPEQIEVFREQVAITCETHPAVRRLLALARPDLDRHLRERQGG